jgi:hypothetical protein
MLFNQKCNALKNSFETPCFYLGMKFYKSPSKVKSGGPEKKASPSALN